MAEETREEIESRYGEDIKWTKKYYGTWALASGIMGLGALYWGLREPTWDPEVVERYEDVRDIKDNLRFVNPLEDANWSLERLSEYSPKEDWSEDRRQAILAISELKSGLENMPRTVQDKYSEMDKEFEGLLENNPSLEDYLIRKGSDVWKIFLGGFFSLFSLGCVYGARMVCLDTLRDKKRTLRRFDWKHS
ncbi:MAG: hypothetical protein ABIF88_00265 [archaeon]